MMPRFVCEGCKKHFTRDVNKGPAPRFCLQCGIVHQRAQRARYSATRYSKKKALWTPRVITCKQCGVEFKAANRRQPYRIYCDKCRAPSQSLYRQRGDGKGAPRVRKCGWESWQPRGLVGGQCEMCGLPVSRFKARTRFCNSCRLDRDRDSARRSRERAKA